MVCKGTKWMVGWGWLEKPVNTPSNQTLGTIEAWFKSSKGFSEGVGEWAFYIMIILIFITLIKKFHIIGLLKLTSFCISLPCFCLSYSYSYKIDYWSEPIGLLLIILLVSGSIAAFISLFQKDWI